MKARERKGSLGADAERVLQKVKNLGGISTEAESVMRFDRVKDVVERGGGYTGHEYVFVVKAYESDRDRFVNLTLSCGISTADEDPDGGRPNCGGVLDLARRTYGQPDLQEKGLPFDDFGGPDLLQSYPDDPEADPEPNYFVAKTKKGKDARKASRYVDKSTIRDAHPAEIDEFVEAEKRHAAGGGRTADGKAEDAAKEPEKEPEPEKPKRRRSRPKKSEPKPEAETASQKAERLRAELAAAEAAERAEASAEAAAAAETPPPAPEPEAQPTPPPEPEAEGRLTAEVKRWIVDDAKSAGRSDTEALADLVVASIRAGKTPSDAMIEHEDDIQRVSERSGKGTVDLTEEVMSLVDEALEG